MYTVRSIPISRARTVGERTYFSGSPYSAGSLISVPLRKGETQALVLSCEEVRASKTALRSSSFTLRKIRKQPSTPCLSQAHIEACIKTATYHATSLGSVLFSLIPKSFFVVSQAVPPSKQILPSPHTNHCISLYQAPYTMRVAYYRSLIREAFAKKKSVFIVVPTLQSAEHLYHTLGEGIEHHTLLLHGGLTPKKQQASILQVLQNEHPLMLITTPHFLSLPRNDLATIILEQEHASSYVQHVSPFLDFRIFAKELAISLGIHLIIADVPLRSENVYYREQGVYADISTGCQRMRITVPTELVDMKKGGLVHTGEPYTQEGETKDTIPSQEKKPFQAVGDVLLKHISTTLNAGERVFLYTARKGLAPTTLCRDCETTVSCTVCEAPLVLHKGAHHNFYLCHACGMSYDAQTIVCAGCGGWRLDTIGIGIEKVAQEIQNVFPSTPLFTLSRDTAHTHTQAQNITKAWEDTAQSILLGTELALPYLKNTALIAVVSLDSLLSLPRWNVYEHVASIITRLQGLAVHRFVLQTRHAHNTLFSDILEGNFTHFQKNELAQRKKLGYPPFGTIIKIGVRGSLEAVHEHLQSVATLVAPFSLTLAEHPRILHETTYILYGFLHLKEGVWPHKELADRLATLPPLFSIQINPENVL